MNDGIITRRDFLKGTAAITVGSIAGVSLPGILGASDSEEKTRVVLIRDRQVLDDTGMIRTEVLLNMLDKAVVKLMQSPDQSSAWKRLIKPSDTVGIKSNAWRYLPTPPELEQAIKQRVVDAGVPAEKIAIDDRGVRQHPIFQQATALINVRPLRTHHWAGIGGCIKNYIMFIPDPASYHADSCADLAKIWTLPAVQGKTRLCILSALTFQFHGRGPHHFDRRYLFPYYGLIVGTDPVSVDSVGLALVKAKRREFFGEERNLETMPHHILYAETRHHVGICDQNRLEILKEGTLQDMLI